MSIIPLRDLLSEIIDSHSDPDNPDYNQCDVDPCAWCESAIVHIAEMVLRKIGGDAAYNPPTVKPARSVQVTYKRIGKMKPRQFPADLLP